MGVGKSTVCDLLLRRLRPGAFLNGDWCWMLSPLIASEENKAMALRNITCLL